MSVQTPLEFNVEFVKFVGDLKYNYPPASIQAQRDYEHAVREVSADVEEIAQSCSASELIEIFNLMGNQQTRTNRFYLIKRLVSLRNSIDDDVLEKLKERCPTYKDSIIKIKSRTNEEKKTKKKKKKKGSKSKKEEPIKIISSFIVDSSSSSSSESDDSSSTSRRTIQKKKPNKPITESSNVEDKEDESPGIVLDISFDEEEEEYVSPSPSKTIIRANKKRKRKAKPVVASSSSNRISNTLTGKRGSPPKKNKKNNDSLVLNGSKKRKSIVDLIEVPKRNDIHRRKKRKKIQTAVCLLNNEYDANEPQEPNETIAASSSSFDAIDINHPHSGNTATAQLDTIDLNASDSDSDNESITLASNNKDKYHTNNIDILPKIPRISEPNTLQQNNLPSNTSSELIEEQQTNTNINNSHHDGVKTLNDLNLSDDEKKKAIISFEDNIDKNRLPRVITVTLPMDSFDFDPKQVEIYDKEYKIFSSVDDIGSRCILLGEWLGYDIEDIVTNSRPSDYLQLFRENDLKRITSFIRSIQPNFNIFQIESCFTNALVKFKEGIHK